METKIDQIFDFREIYWFNIEVFDQLPLAALALAPRRLAAPEPPPGARCPAL